MSKRNLKYLIAFVVIIAILVSAGITTASWGPSTHTQDCPDCGGSGEVDNNTEDCAYCGGRGEVMAGTDADGNEIWNDCTGCGGEGEVISLMVNCPACEGDSEKAEACTECKDLKVEKTFICSTCNGERVTEDGVSCAECSGAGIVIKTVEYKGKVFNEKITCPDCAGHGSDPMGVVCGCCGGSGEVISLTVTCDNCEGEGIVSQNSDLYATFWGLVPPIIAIALALITKEVFSSLFIGILVGALFYSNFNPIGAFDAVTNIGFIDAVAGNAGIFIFLVILGVMVALVNMSGGAAAFGRWAVKNIKTRVGALFATFVLGVLIFIDDYFNCLTVGSVMTPITDRHKISRAKLSYLIDATAAPVCMIAPVSSWAAAVSSIAKKSGGAYDGIELFCRAIPYNFYSLLTFVFVIGIIVMNLDYGPMKLYELNAMVNGDLGAVEDTKEAKENDKGIILDLLLPIVLLIVCCVIGLVYVGGLFDGADFISAFADTDATVGLPLGALVALILTILYLILRSRIKFKDAMEAIPRGFVAMVPAILILTFAVSLKNMTGVLGTDVFIDNLMKNAAPGLANFLPAIIFVVACFLAFSTGTSWGTFGILIPIVTGVFRDPTSPLYIIGISACLAGAVCGDHCSPISDTTIMASAGAKCDHVTHVSTQLPYVLTVAAISFVCFILAGIIQNAFIVLPIGIALTIGVLFGIKFLTKKKG